MSSYEAVILASIIEKEGVEKRRISGVFNRRLIKGMKLQSDPTVIYALGDQFDGNIRRSDLRIKNPYNTYVYKGLPPSPIGLVSKSSIEASTNPEPGSLYILFQKVTELINFLIPYKNIMKQLKDIN